MKQQHKECIASNLVDSISKLLEGKVRHQVIVNSSGKANKRIVIDYD